MTAVIATINQIVQITAKRNGTFIKKGEYTSNPSIQDQLLFSQNSSNSSKQTGVCLFSTLMNRA